MNIPFCDLPCFQPENQFDLSSILNQHPPTTRADCIRIQPGGNLITLLAASFPTAKSRAGSDRVASPVLFLRLSSSLRKSPAGAFLALVVICKLLLSLIAHGIFAIPRAKWIGRRESGK